MSSPTPQTAVVTGASAGVGRAVVRELARNGWNVAVVARGRAGVDAACAEVADAGQRAHPVLVDVADAGRLDTAARGIEQDLGPIEAWVNVAFVGALRYFWDTPPEAFDRITAVTYLGQVNGTRAALARMRPRNRGVILNVGSALAFRGIPLQAAYCGAKHAIQGFTESVRTELKSENSNIRIGTVQLPAMNTPQFNWNDNGFEQHPQPVAPIFQPEPAARAIRFMIEHSRRNMWVGASTAYTILGNRILPGFLDWYLGRKGVDGQLTTQDGPRLGSNLDQPRDEIDDAGARGMFDDQAYKRDPLSGATMAWAALADRLRPRR